MLLLGMAVVLVVCAGYRKQVHHVRWVQEAVCGVLVHCVVDCRLQPPDVEDEVGVGDRTDLARAQLYFVRVGSGSVRLVTVTASPPTWEASHSRG